MSNINDFKVVTFKNISNFEFTPALGAKFDGRSIFGKAATGIKEGEELQLPFHVGNRLAINLAKQICIQDAPAPVHGKGDPSAEIAGDLMSEEKINKLVSKILVDQYQEDKPIPESETDKAFRKIKELNETVKEEEIKSEGFRDKKEVIEELEKRDIAHDKRKSKKDLEELLKG